MKVNDNKSFFVDFYSTSVHEDSEVIKEITDIICRTGTVENRKDVGVFWWNEFQTMFTNSYSKGFETQNELERKSLEHTLEMFHASENADELSNLMFAHWIKPPIFEGTKEFFERSPISIYIVSNIDTSDIMDAISFHSLSPAGVFISEDAKAYKPSVELFNLAPNSCGLSPNEVIHISASICTDVKGERALNIKPLWINRFGKDVPDGIKSIETLLDAIKMIRK
jgi:HAD-superfamily hydrolase, subfamily IA, variant 1